MLASEARQIPERDGGGISEWLIEVSHHVGEHIQGFRLDDQLVMLGAMELRDLASIAELAIRFLAEANRKSTNRAIKQLRHHAHDYCRVDATAQMCTERHLAHQTDPD